MALFTRIGAHSYSRASSLFWKFLRLVPRAMIGTDRPRSCSEMKRSFQSHTSFSTLSEHTCSREGAQGELERTLGSLSQGQSTKEEKINAWLYDMRDSTLEKICNGSIPLHYSNFMMDNHSTRGIAPAPRKVIAPAPRKVIPGPKYKLLKFGGRIVYCQTASEVEEATVELLDKIKAMSSASSKVPLGFDVEWKPSSVKGRTPGKTALIQICIDATCCYVMHIIHSGIPSILKSLLEDSSSVKVGVGIAYDANKIVNDYGVSMRSLKDLSDLASTKLAGPGKKWSLSSLTETIFCKQLDKRNNIRLGNWENVLSKKQLQYAATDAFASWHLHEVLSGMPDLEIEKDNSLEHKKKNKRKNRKKARSLAKL